MDEALFLGRFSLVTAGALLAAASGLVAFLGWRRLGWHRLVAFPPERKRIDIGDFYGDITKIRTRLGWTPSISLRQGLTETLEYYRAHKEHYL